MSEDTVVGDSDAEIARNRNCGAGVVDDPYPTLHALRAQCPRRWTLLFWAWSWRTMPRQWAARG